MWVKNKPIQLKKKNSFKIWGLGTLGESRYSQIYPLPPYMTLISSDWSVLFFSFFTKVLMANSSQNTEFLIMPSNSNIPATPGSFWNTSWPRAALPLLCIENSHHALAQPLSSASPEEMCCIWCSNGKQKGNPHCVSAAQKAASRGVQLDLATTWWAFTHPVSTDWASTRLQALS